MTSRKPWQFRARARGLGIPDAASEYVLGAIGHETAVPVMLRRAALIGADQGLNPYGLAAQIRKLLSWDWRQHPGDYMGDPRGEPIHVQQEDVRAAILGRGAWHTYDADEDMSPGATRAYLDKHAERAWAAHACQYGYALPSYGTSYDHCGQLRANVCIDHDGKPSVRITRWRCRRLSCPTCYESSIKYAARRVADRLLAGAILRQSAVYHRRRVFTIHHVVVSIHPSHYDLLRSPGSADAYRGSVIRQMKWLGYWGGAAIYHPWRFDKDLDRPRFAPHFHFLASGYVDRSRYLDRYGRAVMRGEMEDHPIREVHRRTGGDVFVKLADAESYGEVCRLAAYLLTHAGQRIAERRADREQADGLADADAACSQPPTGRHNSGQAVTYFGDVAPNKFATKKILARSRGAGSDIRRMVSDWEERPHGWSLSGASVQAVTFPLAGGPGGPDGSAFDANLRAAAYGDPEHVPADGLAAHLRALAAYGDNALISTKSTGGCQAGGKAPYRYAVVRLRYVRTRGGYGRDRAVRRYAVIALNPATEPLCAQCGAILRVGVRADGSGIPPPDDDHPEGVQYADGNASDWEYYEPRGRHAGMGVPYYAADGSPRWDTGVPTIPADIRDMPVAYQLHLEELVDEQIERYAVAAMCRESRHVDVDVARRAARRHLAGAGRPDKMQPGWEEVLLANVWGEYAMMVRPARRQAGPDVIWDGDGR